MFPAILDLSIRAAMTAMTPRLEPQRPSKNDERIHVPSVSLHGRVTVLYNSTYLIPDQLLENFMPCNGEDKAETEHTQRDDNSSREGITERAIDHPALKSDKSCKND